MASSHESSAPTSTTEETSSATSRPESDFSAASTSSLMPVVALGGSAGSIEALQVFFRSLPSSPGCAFVVGVHQSPDYESSLSDVLQSASGLNVVDLNAPIDVRPDTVYVLPPQQSLRVSWQEKSHGSPDDDSPETGSGKAPSPEGEKAFIQFAPAQIEDEHKRRLPLDLMYRELATLGPRLVAVVLSGTGTDASVGIREVQKEGGLVYVQAPNQAAYDGMPRAAIDTGHVDAVLSVEEIASRVPRLPTLLALRSKVEPFSLGSTSISDQPKQAQTPGYKQADALEPASSVFILNDDDQKTISKIFTHLRLRTGNDFSQYKQSTMLRRIGRRMQVTQSPGLLAYLEVLRKNEEEVHLLQQDLLITVTSFFRDPASFQALESVGIPHLFEGKGPDDEIRVWVAGCATGEEAYSIAMLLLEAADAHPAPPRIQIFATDLDSQALETARVGRYPAPIALDVSPERLGRFFETDGSSYRAKAMLREPILFAPHNLLSDPPFSNIDLISCRNLLIYLRRELQSTIFKLFHYALRGEGLMFLGESESAEAMKGFSSLDTGDAKLYRRVDEVSLQEYLTALPFGNVGFTSLPIPQKPQEPAILDIESTHRSSLEDHAPPSVLVGPDRRILHLSPSASRYLVRPGGVPTDQILESIRSELHAELYIALQEAIQQGVSVLTPPIRISLDGEPRPLVLSVHPTRTEVGTGALIFFLEATREVLASPQDDSHWNQGTAESDNWASSDESDASFETLSATADMEEPSQGEKQEPPAEGDNRSEEDLRALLREERAVNQQLQTQLQRTRGQLRAAIEEHKGSKEEMQASNEELRSINEEYKSTAEELETSKEELQSVNEELQTVNQELESKVDELKQSNSDLQNLLASTDIGTLFLGKDLDIRRYTPRIEDLFGVRQSDIGRSIADIAPRVTYDSLIEDAREVLRNLSTTEVEAQGPDDHWFLVRMRPYRTVDDRIDGVVITFIDITKRKEAEEKLRHINDTLEERVTEQTRQVRALSEALTIAEEEERRRISMLLHDDLQQTLYGVEMTLTNLHQNLTEYLAQTDSDSTEEKSPDVEKRYQTIEAAEERAAMIKRGLDKAISSTRSLSADLNPMVLDESSLRLVCNQLAWRMEEEYGLSVDVNTDGPVHVSARDVRVLLYRIMRELLFNVHKHAAVGKARIEARDTGDEIFVAVEDKGVGFDPNGSANPTSPSGMGLASVPKRIEALGGQFKLLTAPGEGTRIEVSVPAYPDRNSPTEES